MTIHDVAARAGVSVATVSRVLNGKEVVREETLKQVLAAAKALHYVPNVAARSLSIQRSQTIGIVLPDVHGEFFSEVIRGIDVAARREGYHILVSGSHSDVGEMLEVLDAMRGRVDGLVVMAPDVAHDLLHESLPPNLPLVLLNSTDGGVDGGRDAITIDNHGGAQAMMRYLAGLGHTGIAFIKGPAQNADARERLRGYRGVMRKLGIRATRRLELAGDFTEESGRAAAQKILNVAPRPTAIFAANDSMAVGALAALAEAGVAVPAEMSVAGFDDIPIARYVTPPLTTIRVDIADLGRRAFGLLRGAIAQPAAPAGRRDCIATTLVERKSCCSPEIRMPTSRRPDRKPRGRKKGEES
ncbi:MAG TPA: LacI family DNA-binding transcriptional regulator [Thermoanaerobaculia bacterium]|nr:LacI family DNA-binding transcriptional regulator [Thermoanaerobaculia bacterium]